MTVSVLWLFLTVHGETTVWCDVTTFASCLPGNALGMPFLDILRRYQCAENTFEAGKAIEVASCIGYGTTSSQYSNGLRTLTLVQSIHLSGRKMLEF